MSEIAHLRSALERLAVAATHIDHDVAALMSELSAPQVLSESASADLDAFERRWQPAVARQRATVEAVARQLDFGQPAPSAPNADMLARAAEAALAHFQAQTESLKGVLEELGVPDMRELDVRLPPPPPPPAKQPLQLQPYQQPQLEPQPQHHQHPTLHQQPVAASLSDALEAPPIAAMAEPPTPAFAPPPTPAQQPLPSTPVQLRDKRKSSVLSPLSPQTPFGRVLANIASSGALSQIAPSRARFDEIPDSPTLEDLGLSSLSRQMLEGKPQASSASGGASARAARSDAGLSRFESLSLSSARAGSPEIASAAQGRPAIARQPSAASMRLRSAMSMSSIDSPELSEQALPSLTHHIGARNSSTSLASSLNSPQMPELQSTHFGTLAGAPDTPVAPTKSNGLMSDALLPELTSTEFADLEPFWKGQISKQFVDSAIDEINELITDRWLMGGRSLTTDADSFTLGELARASQMDSNKLNTVLLALLQANRIRLVKAASSFSDQRYRVAH